jgi:hypothetical protein
MFVFLQMLPHQHPCTHKSLSYFSIHSLSLFHVSLPASLCHPSLFLLSLSHVHLISIPINFHRLSLTRLASSLTHRLFISHSSFSGVHPLPSNPFVPLCSFHPLLRYVFSTSSISKTSLSSILYLSLSVLGLSQIPSLGLYPTASFVFYGFSNAFYVGFLFSSDDDDDALLPPLLFSNP